MRIGVFDSGLGGINVLKELINKYPNNHYIYYGDTLNLPYGNKSKEELMKLATNIINYLISREVDIIIIACGTISSNCYNELKALYNVPIYDIITPTLNYIKNSNYRNLGLIATNGTVNSQIFANNPKISIIKATPSFVPIIESNKILENIDNIINELSVFKNKVDGLILGCTHYPILKDIINDYLNVPIIDMGKILVNSISITEDQYKVELLFTKLDDNIKENVHSILNTNYSIMEK